MITVVTYYCEICQRQYFDDAEALKCEAQGKQPLIPIGLIYGRPQNKRDHLQRDLVFCVAQSWNDRHLCATTSYACRDTGMGDSLGRQQCGGLYGYTPGIDESPDPKHSTFKRMVKWLKKHKPNLDITVWDGKKPVPLKEYLKEKK